MGRRYASAVAIALAAIACAVLLMRREAPLRPIAVVPDASVVADAEDDALGRAWKRVTASPRDAAGWIALGDAEAELDQLEAAEHAYRTAIRAGGGPLAYAQLGFLLYARGAEGEALSYLLEAKRRGSDAPMLDYTLDRLREHHAIPDGGQLARAAPAPVEEDAGTAAMAIAEPDGGDSDASVRRKLSCTVPVRSSRARQGMIVDVLIRGTRASLLVDTGATVTVVTEELADRLGLPRGARSFNVVTANGRTSFASTHLPRISLAGRSVEDVVVAVCPDCASGVADGLLGLDLQAAFGLSISPGDRAIRFLDCTP